MKHVSTSFSQGIFKNIIFRSLALVIKKLWAISFLHTPDFLPPCMHIKKYKKNHLNYHLLKVKKFHGDKVKNEKAKRGVRQMLGVAGGQ